jgi:tRNA (adenine57-N1/adenine58-N1)-methyltransferase
LLTALQRFEFGFIEVCEIMLRYYKAVPERLRPTDRMVAHTGYLIFARSLIPMTKPQQDLELSNPSLDSDSQVIDTGGE